MLLIIPRLVFGLLVRLMLRIFRGVEGGKREKYEDDYTL
jgi:hypothetical protein